MLELLRELAPVAVAFLTCAGSFFVYRQQERKRSQAFEEVSKAVAPQLASQYGDARGPELVTDALGILSSAVLGFQEFVETTLNKAERKQTISRLLEELTLIREHLGEIARIMRKNRHDAANDEMRKRGQEHLDAKGER